MSGGARLVAAAGCAALAAWCLAPATPQEGGPARFQTSRAGGRALPLPPEDDAFTFAIFGDRTGGAPEGVEVLAQAVADVNLVGPDLVMTVGDLVQGYNARGEWLGEMRQFRATMDRLAMPWFPVAGNHDIYWRGEGRPPTEHEADYETHFGPLWYAFSHKGCWFVVCYSDEGHPTTGVRGFDDPEAQKMSATQFAWLDAVLTRAKGARHVLVFLHHPRWFGAEPPGAGGYGTDWERVHERLRKAGNVSAVFAGHIHRMTYAGARDGIEYFTLATVGGDHGPTKPETGHLDHWNLVTVRGGRLAMAAFPVGTAMDPRLVGRGNDFAHEATVLATTEWTVTSEETRKQRFALAVPAFGAREGQLRIGVGHSTDDSGDRGVACRLYDSEGRCVLEHFCSSKGVVPFRHPATPGSAWVFEIEDADTRVEKGKHPGNWGTVKAVVKW